MHKENSSEQVSVVIKVDNLVFKYYKNNTNVLSIPRWRVNSQEAIFLNGYSGSGKSTLIHLLSGLLTPSAGSIVIENTAINQLNARKMNAFRAAHIGLISQSFNLIPYLSVFENIKLALSFNRSHIDDLLNKTKELMQQLELNEHIIHRKSAELSFGQQQRVAIARALINKPRVLLADEPTSALDRKAKFSFLKTLIKLVEDNQMTLVFVSHDTNLAQYFSKTVYMDELNVA